jgi:serine/threonine protein kinase
MHTCQALPTKVDTLGRYEIRGELGRGTISVVYEARDLLTDGAVALKLIEPSLWGQPNSGTERLLFLTEAMAAWRLKHPNIVTVYDAGDGDGKVYLAMERVAGPSLRRMIDESPSLGIGRSIRIAVEIASAVAHAHERGVVHRGLTPSNILMQPGDRPKITDFGLAPLQEAAHAASNHTAYLPYMSPEQIRCEEPIDGRSDVFSLGVVLYEMLTGRLPFGGASPAEIMRQMLEAEPLLPSEQNSHIPPALDGLVLSMLAKNPDDRAPSAEVIARSLRRLEEDLDSELAADGRYEDATVEAAMTADTRASDERQEAPILQQWDSVPTPAPRPSTYALVALILAAAGMGALWQWRQSSDSNETRVAAIAAEAATAIRAEPATAIPPETPLSREPPLATPEPPEKKKRASKVAARQPSAGATASVPAPAPETPPSVVAFKAPPKTAVTPLRSVPPAREAPPKTSGRAPAKTATVQVDVFPWGEIYVDGKPRGTTPPLKTFALPPGRHRIEVRNPSQPPYITFATLQAGEVRRIRHQFD